MTMLILSIPSDILSVSSIFLLSVLATARGFSIKLQFAKGLTSLAVS